MKSTRIHMDSGSNVCISQASKMKSISESVKALRLSPLLLGAILGAVYLQGESAGGLSVLVPRLRIGQKEKGTEDLGGCEPQFCAHGKL